MSRTPKRHADRDALLLASYLEKHRGTMKAAAWAQVLSSLLFVSELFALALAIDSVLQSTPPSPLAYFIGAVAGIAGLRVAIEVTASRAISGISRAVALKARGDLLDAIARISPLDQRRPHAGELAALISGHIDALGPYLTRYIPSKLRATVVPVAVLAITVYFSWVAGIVLLVAGPLIPLFMALIGSKARTASENQLREVGSMNGALLDRLQGMTTLKLFDAVARATEQLRQEGNEIRIRTMRVLRIAFVSSAVLELFSALGVALVAVYVGFNLLGYFSFGAYGGLSLFAGIFVLMIAPEFFRPLRDFAAAYHDRAAATAASAELRKVLEGNWIALPSGRPYSVDMKSLRLNNVGLELAGRTLLSGVSFEIKQGERVGLVGASGTGKSLLLAVIAGLVEPTEGYVLTNGIIDRACHAAWLGQAPAFLQQSVSSNLRLYRREKSADDMEKALRVAQAEHVVATLARGFNEIIRENASNLSGGEAQRLAIARLALSDADLIIADEPTEHLDAETASAVIEGLISLAQGRTLLVATHDPRLIARMTRVIDVTTIGALPQDKAA